jgi:leader peptidase (prepilin peptidase) / N-methyltransferase
VFELLHYPSVLPILGFLTGAIFGSFLNVFAYRVPIGKSVITPGSHCPNCGTNIRWFQNLPVFTWVFQKGQAQCCSFMIPIRYWLVEISVGLVFAYLAYLYSQDLDLISFIVRLIFSWIMIAVMVIDFETMTIPDRLSVGGALLGVLLCFIFPELNKINSSPSWSLHFLSGIHSCIGLLVGSAFLYWIGVLAQIVFGREALGEGDVKLLGCIGAFCGWQGAIFAIFGGALLGTLLLVPFMLVQKFLEKNKINHSDPEIQWGAEVPFGPYLAIAGIIYFTGASSIIDPWFDPILWFFDNSYIVTAF